MRIINQSNPQKIRRGSADTLFDGLNYLLFTGVILIVVYPLYFVLIASVSDPKEVLNGNLTIWVKGFQLDGYSHIFRSGKIWRGYINSVFYTVTGTSLNILLTMMAGYALSRSDFAARRLIMLVFIFTMYFSGGLIPTYLVVDKLGLVGRWPVMVILGAVNVWNVIIARTFLMGSLYAELQDAARSDGCNDINFLFKIVIPLSKALIAVLCLYYGLSHWNSYLTALIYLKNRTEYPLQLILREILLMNSVDAEMMPDLPGVNEQLQLAAVMKYGLVVVASVPMLVIYPFLQKYFVKGVMLGSLKG